MHGWISGLWWYVSPYANSLLRYLMRFEALIWINLMTSEGMMRTFAIAHIHNLFSRSDIIYSSIRNMGTSKMAWDLSFHFSFGE